MALPPGISDRQHCLYPMNDGEALLRAICEQPWDDTPRLVYADWLEENGNTPRAEFIRFQIEVEHLHPDSNARVRLEERARSLFSEHWIEWWTEVCAAVGLWLPVRKPRGTIGRVLRRIPVINPPGYPYYASSFGIEMRTLNFAGDERIMGMERAEFRRGFPEFAHVSLPLAAPDGGFLARWPTIAPLTSLHVTTLDSEPWPDGPHLAGVQSLTIEGYDPAAQIDAFRSPYLERLEELRFLVYNDTNEYSREALDELNALFAEGLARVLNMPRVHQIRRLTVPVWSERAAEVVAGTEQLAGLESIEVVALPQVAISFVQEPNVTAQWLSTIARSPQLANVRKLTVFGDFDAGCIEALTRKPVWTRLRRLQLQGWFNGLEPLETANDLEELEELRLRGIQVDRDSGVLTPLARSPLLKRLRHFALNGEYRRSIPSLALLVDALDATRIETFAIGARGLQPSDLELCRARFGERLRLLR